jgi:hypothetical protein
MLVVPDLDGDLEHFANDHDVYLNVGQSAVITSIPTMEGLRASFQTFAETLRERLLQLWCMPHEEVVEHFGQLGLNTKNNQRRCGTAWGLAPRAQKESKGLLRVQNKAALRAIVDAGILTEEECGQTKFKGSEGLATFLARQPLSIQQQFFEALLHPGCNLDEIMRLSQGCRLGLSALRDMLDGHSSAEDALRALARDAAANLDIGIAASLTGNGRSYAPVWLAAYLAAEGVWLLPLTMADRLYNAYPKWATPIQLWLSFPKAMHVLCELLLKDFSKGARQTDSVVISVLTALGASSDMWRAPGLRAGPLIGYKAHVQAHGRSGSQRSWAVNRIWDALVHHFGAAANDHPDAHAFRQGKRLLTKGTRPFNWVHAPSPRSLKRFREFFPTYPNNFPEGLRRWASHLEELLPLFRVVSIKTKIRSLELWLLYLSSLEHPPLTFADVSRQRHVHSRDVAGPPCFRGFLLKHFPDTKARPVKSAMATLKQAWALSAELEGFDAQLANPFDAADSPFELEQHSTRTTRSALDARVLEILARENLKNEMEFARQVGDKKRLCWREVRHPETGELTEVFFPAAPLVVHVILLSGMRGKQATWLDSGEGDEFGIDLNTMQRIPNSLPTAIPGRNQGFFRLCEILGDQRERVLGMFVNSGKTGPHEVPWMHPDLVKPLGELIEFQLFWYPLKKPVPIGRGTDFDDRFTPDRGDAFPLMRDPANGLGYPITRARIYGYWKAFLEHCQPIVDAELGYHYPLLLRTGLPHFDIHSLRVSIITTLLDNGVPVSVVQMLVGHKSPVMTWYYHDVTNYKIHSALQVSFERWKGRFKDPSNMTGEGENELSDQHITFRSDKDFVGLEMLRHQRATGAFIDVFSHGICPGGACEKGGRRILEGKYAPIWRPRACSGCRFRVTGPAFLNGLVQRANSLLWEIKASMLQEAEVHAQIEEEEDAGRPVAHLRSAARSEQEKRDSLFEEWCLELRTIERAMVQLRHEPQSTESSGSSLVQGYDLREVTARFREVHQFELAQRVTHDARLVDGLIDLPPGVEAYRDGVLHKIAHSNKISDYFYSLPPTAAKRALTLFGEILVSHTQNDDTLEAIIEGSVLIRDIPGLQSALESGFAEAGILDPSLLETQ